MTKITLGKSVDLSGMVFGSLSVIELFDKRHGVTIWHCICTCGTHVNVRGTSLSSGHTQSCGCFRKSQVRNALVSDISGIKFGRLLALQRIGSNPNGMSIWKCECECGNVVEVLMEGLSTGNTRSCGCLKKELLSKRMTTHGLSGTPEYKRTKRREYKEMSLLLDINWSTDLEIALYRFFHECVICGRTDSLSTDHVYPLSLGYGLMPGNAIVLCVGCNSRKKNKMLSSLPADVSNKILYAASMFKQYIECGGK